MAYPRLARAPITEAVIDLQVDAASFGQEEIAAVRKRMSVDFPHVGERHEVTTTVNPATSSAEVQRHLHGFVMHDERRSSAVHLRMDGFGLSLLHPYSNWEALREGARTYWKIYAEIARPDTVKRVALRYINRIELPQPLSDFDDYFETFPRIGGKLPQSLASFYLRMALPFEDEGVLATITQTIDVAAVSDMSIPVILDIDAYASSSFSPDDDGLWNQLETLRNVKNRVFFGCVTPKCLELFR